MSIKNSKSANKKIVGFLGLTFAKTLILAAFAQTKNYEVQKIARDVYAVICKEPRKNSL